MTPPLSSLTPVAACRVFASGAIPERIAAARITPVLVRDGFDEYVVLSAAAYKALVPEPKAPPEASPFAKACAARVRP